jgi:hypothetical protein
VSRAQINTDISRELDIIARKGDTFILDLEIADAENNRFDVTNHTAKMSILKGRTQRPLITLYSENSAHPGSEITMGNGYVSIQVHSDVTENWKEGEYVYDLQLTSSNYAGGARTLTWLRGKFIINPDITL